MIKIALKLREAYQNKAKINDIDFRPVAQYLKNTSEYFNGCIVTYLKAEEHDLIFAKQIKLAQMMRAIDVLHCYTEREVINHKKSYIPDIYDLIDELKQLEKEFGQVTFIDNKLSVITEAITLEDIPLGEFKIVIDLHNTDHLYYIEAVNPNPAHGDEGVTHPHIRNGHLCEGNGTVPIGSALENGRIADFFLIIKSILETYNPESPYISLEDWFGIECYNCGESTNSEDIYICEGCEERFCDQCVVVCSICGGSYCDECINLCSICGRHICSSCSTTCSNCGNDICDDCSFVCECCGGVYCKSCLTRCEDCGQFFCPGCINEDELCEECAEKEEENEKPSTEV